METARSSVIGATPRRFDEAAAETPRSPIPRAPVPHVVSPRGSSAASEVGPSPGSPGAQPPPRAKEAALQAAFSGCAGMPSRNDRTRRLKEPDLEKEGQGAAGKRVDKGRANLRPAHDIRHLRSQSLPNHSYMPEDTPDDRRRQEFHQGVAMAGKSHFGDDSVSRRKKHVDSNINTFRQGRTSLLHHSCFDFNATDATDATELSPGAAGEPSVSMNERSLAFHRPYRQWKEHHDTKALQAAHGEKLAEAPWRDDGKVANATHHDVHTKKQCRTVPPTTFGTVVFGRDSAFTPKTMSLHDFNELHGGAAGMTSYTLSKQKLHHLHMYVHNGHADQQHNHSGLQRNQSGAFHGNCVGSDLSSTISEVSAMQHQAPSSSSVRGSSAPSGGYCHGGGGGGDFCGSEAGLSYSSATPRRSRTSAGEDVRRNDQTPRRSSRGSSQGAMSSIGGWGSRNGHCHGEADSVASILQDTYR